MSSCSAHRSCRAVRRAGLAFELVVLVVCLFATSGCAGLSKRADRALLAHVPNEELLVLFDAENDVYIARDEAALAARHLEDAERASRRALAFRKRIEERRKSGAAVDTAPILALLERWNEARIAMRAQEIALRAEELKTSDVRLWAARARYELAKAKLIREKNPEGGATLDLPAFEVQVAEWEMREKEAQAALEVRRAELLAARTAYIDLALELQRASNGVYGGPWADLLD